MAGSREGLLHALISPFIFYANETTSPLHDRFCRDGEIEFHRQYFSNAKTVTSTVVSQHDKTNTLICRPSEFYYQPGHRQSDRSASVRRK